MSNKIIIVGAGIAGVSCYKDLKSQGYDVTIVEASDQVGGNVRDTTVNGYTFDIGSIEVFDWYYYFREMFPEIFDPVDGIVFEDNRIITRVVNVGNEYISPVSDVQTQSILAGLLDLQLPSNLNWYKDLTMRYYEQPLPKQNLDMKMCEPLKIVGVPVEIFESYTYGDCSNQSLYFFLPLVSRTQLKSSGSKEYIRNGGLQTVLKNAVNPSDLLLNTKVVGVSHNGSLIKVEISDGTILLCNKIVLTCPYGNIHKQQLEMSGYTDTSTGGYTKYLAFVVKAVGEIQKEWSAGFESQDKKLSYQIVSYFSVSNLVGNNIEFSDNIYVIYVVNNTGKTPVSPLDIFRNLPKPPMFKDTTLTVLDSTYFPHTMPIMHPETVVSLRKAQGKNGVYYAGQYMGHPSMETACYTGKLVASMISGKKLSPSVRDVNKKHFGPFFMTIFDTNAYALVAGTAVLTALIVDAVSK
jgi:hypothetical protein